MLDYRSVTITFMKPFQICKEKSSWLISKSLCMKPYNLRYTICKGNSSWLISKSLCMKPYNLRCNICKKKSSWLISKSLCMKPYNLRYKICKEKSSWLISKSLCMKPYNLRYKICKGKSSSIQTFINLRSSRSFCIQLYSHNSRKEHSAHLWKREQTWSQPPRRNNNMAVCSLEKINEQHSKPLVR